MKIQTERMFGQVPEPKYQKAPRYPLEYYVLTDERVKELKRLIRSGDRYAPIASQVAHTANKDIESTFTVGKRKPLL